MYVYSTDLRERVIRAIDQGSTIPEAAETFEVGTATVSRWLRLRREQGHLAPAAPAPRRSVLDEHEKWLAELDIELVAAVVANGLDQNAPLFLRQSDHRHRLVPARSGGKDPTD